MKYSKKTIADAILILEIRGGDHGYSAHCHPLCTADTYASLRLATQAWVDVRLPGGTGEEALEAAARLREGSLPGTPGWER